jgi:hypothetical protein
MLFNEYYKIIFHIADLNPIVLILSFIIGLYTYKRLNDLHKNVLYYLVLMLCVDILGRVLAAIYGANIIVLPLYSLVEMLFFLYFYNKYLFFKPSKIFIFLGIAGTLYIIAEITQYFILETLNLKQYQPYGKVVDNFVIILMTLTFFYQKIDSFNETRWDNFKLNMVVLIYFTINTLVFLPFNFLVNESSGVKFYFLTGNVFMTFFFYVYLTSLVWKNGTANKRLIQ